MTEPSPLGLPEEPHRDLPADYQRALVETVVDIDVVTELVRRNLEEADVRRILGKLDRQDRDGFLSRLSALLRKTSALLLISRQLSDSLFVDVLLPRLVELICDFLEAERCSVFLYDKRTGELVTKVASGLDAEIRFPANQGIAGAVFASGQPLLIPDAYADPRFNTRVDEETGFRTRDLLCVPLKHVRAGHAETVGVAQVLNKRRRGFDDEDVKLLEALAAPAATALANAMLHEEVRRARSEESQFLEVSAALSREVDLRPLLGRIAATAASVLDAERVTLLVRDRRSGELWGMTSEDAGAGVGPSHPEIADLVFRSGEGIVLADPAADPRFDRTLDAKAGRVTRSLACLPVRDRDGATVAVVEALDKRGGAFAAGDLEHLAAFCAQTAIAMQNARMVDDLNATIQRLRSLLEASEALSGAADLDSQLAVILSRARGVVDAERSRLWVHDEKEDVLRSREPGDAAARPLRVPVGVGFAGHSARSGAIVNVADATRDHRFDPALEPAGGAPIRSLLCAPMYTHAGRLIGVLEVMNKAAGPFGAQDEALLSAFASHAAVALDRARLVEAFVDKQKIEHGLRLAHDIQMAMLPRVFPAAAEFEIAARLEPARSVGGDLYDFLVKDGALWFTLGDVSGKGIGAALFMTMAKTLLRAAMGSASLGPGALFERVNRELYRDNERGLYVTTFLGRLDLATGALAFANAGHNPPYIVRADGRVEPLHGGLGLPLGLMDGPGYESAAVTLAAGDALYLYTDGVTEALSPGGEEFTPARLEVLLAARAGVSSADLVGHSFAAVKEHAAGAPPSDDITALAVRYLGARG